MHTPTLYRQLVTKLHTSQGALGAHGTKEKWVAQIVSQGPTQPDSAWFVLQATTPLSLRATCTALAYFALSRRVCTHLAQRSDPREYPLWFYEHREDLPVLVLLKDAYRSENSYHCYHCLLAGSHACTLPYTKVARARGEIPAQQLLPDLLRLSLRDIEASAALASVRTRSDGAPVEERDERAFLFKQEVSPQSMTAHRQACCLTPPVKSGLGYFCQELADRFAEQLRSLIAREGALPLEAEAAENACPASGRCV